MIASAGYIFILFLSFVEAQNTETPNIVGSSGGLRTLPSTTIEMNNVRANQWIQSYEQFSSQYPSSPVVEAARATVQLIPKCSIGRRGDNNYYIGQFSPVPFCSGPNTNHPLASGGGPTARNPTAAGESYPTYNGSPPCGDGGCSGFLVGDQQTIGTAGHCLRQKSPQDFCKDYVVVFNRTGNRTDFSNNDIYECEGGTSVDTVQGANINFTSDGQGFKDHAFLRLKKPVPATVATALEVSDAAPTRGETLYAVGHPDGNPRMVSPMTYTVSPNRNGYSYLQGNGYVYQGNSGGPLLDSRGRVRGIVASTDDTVYGVPSRRQPMVRTEDNPRACRTQIATTTNIIEAVGFSREVRAALESQVPTPSPAAEEAGTVQ